MSQSDFVSRGQTLVGQGQFQEAVKVCRLGLLGRPTTVEGRIVLGQALLALKRYDEVLAEMRVALELDGSVVDAYVLKGEALLRKGDNHAANEALLRALQLAPNDPRIGRLLADAGHPMRPVTASHPAAGFVGGETKNYPKHHAGSGEEDSFTKPTSLATPGPLRKSSEKRAAVEVPSQQELEVGDRSGTVEVDPDVDAVESSGDHDFDDLAAPPIAGKRPREIGGERGQVKLARGIAPPVTIQPRRAMREPLDDFAPKRMEPTMDLDDDDDDEDLYETHLPVIDPARRAPGPGTAVRNAVAMPSGPIDAPPEKRPTMGRAAQLPPPRSKPPSAQPPLNIPAILNPIVPPTPQPLPPPPRIAAALPTVAAGPPATLHSVGVPPPQLPSPHQQPMQPMPLGMPSQASMAAAARPTLAIAAPPPPSPSHPSPMFGADSQPNWGQPMGPDPRSFAASMEPTMQPHQVMDPAVAALLAGQQPLEHASIPAIEQPPMVAPSSGPKTGMRKGRTRTQIALWVLVGAGVIGGGVFAGFWIRSMRLQKQIVAAREHATDLAKADSWAGWVAARDSLAGIVQASGTVENRAALARARGLIAFEFGDGVADAKAAVDGLGGQGGLDGSIAAAYVALAQSDAHAAKLAADAALAAAAQDPAALYVSGQSALLAGDLKSATTYLKSAVEHDARPLYRVGLARALAASFAWDEALDAIDRVRASDADHPAASIERGVVLASSGRIGPGSNIGTDVHTQLDRLIAEGGRPIGEQQHGVSPAQVAYAELSLARVDFARGDQPTALSDIKRAGEIGLDDQTFAEDAIETLYAVGDLATAKKLAEGSGKGDGALAQWPTSRRLRTTLAEILLAMGRPAEALETLDKQPEMLGAPMPQAVRGEARLASGDVDGARADFENALKKVPGLEPALIGRAWLDLDAGNADDAKKLIEPHYNAKSASPALATVYAAILRRAADADTRDKAKGILEKVIAGPPSLDEARAQLELARLERDSGDFRAARAAYAEASKTGNYQARLETALLQIEDRDPGGGRETLDGLLREAGARPSGRLVIEAARAHMLVGDHPGATQLIETATKLPDVAKWQLERERGRLALRRGDFAGAILALSSALDGCGDDSETFLLAADAAAAGDAKGAPALVEKLKKLAPMRLANVPELSIVKGKLLIGAGKFSEALDMFTQARTRLEKIASARRMAQARFGVSVANYNLKNDAAAKSELDLVITLDPSMYAAYLYLVDLLGPREQRHALELAQNAVTYNPDVEPGWVLVGQLAAKLGNRKVLADAIAKVGALAPGSDDLKQLQALKR